MFTSPILLVLWLFGIGAQAQTYSATYLPSNAPNQTEQGQSGTNQCGNGTSQTSECQNAYCELDLLEGRAQLCSAAMN